MRLSVTNGVKLCVSREQVLLNSLMNIAQAIKVEAAIHLGRQLTQRHLTGRARQQAMLEAHQGIRHGLMAAIRAIADRLARHMAAAQIIVHRQSHRAIRRHRALMELIITDQTVLREHLIGQVARLKPSLI